MLLNPTSKAIYLIRKTFRDIRPDRSTDGTNSPVHPGRFRFERVGMKYANNLSKSKCSECSKYPPKIFIQQARKLYILVL